MSIQNIKGHNARWSIQEVLDYLQDKATKTVASRGGSNADVTAEFERLKDAYAKHLTLEAPTFDNVVHNGDQVIIGQPKPIKNVIHNET